MLKTTNRQKSMSTENSSLVHRGQQRGETRIPIGEVRKSFGVLELLCMLSVKLGILSQISDFNFMKIKIF